MSSAEDGAPEVEDAGQSRSNAIVTAGLFIVGIGLFVTGVLADSAALRLVGKPIPVLALTSFAALQKKPYARWIAGGLFLGAVGDVFLEISKNLFVAGLVAFLLGHIAYVIAFFLDEKRLKPALLIPPLALGGLVIWQLWPGLGALKVPVVVYMFVICAMAWRAAARLSMTRGDTVWALAGAVLFLISDSTLGFHRFGGSFPGARAVILVTYWAAQMCIALSTHSGGVVRSRTFGG
ncbi:MAG: lysoplasmalogenase [Polyangiaceae bacterium]|nr:lysoplasmalogenase [Polyangiaceae bacterium]